MSSSAEFQEFDVGPNAGDTAAPRPWIGVLFDCCGVYARVYRAVQAREYRGACPRCRRPLVVPVGPQGTPQRLFRAQ